ncbi:ligase-associated DNA damage response DEXH box helicase [Fulvivirga sp. RKSG066]|uniref:ligase-associated DNA damage response DEXH box helicase n=1 Tax=Fulvivirga aurantia TaxID=2529383 RepID=UPI0012BCF2F9|nr:ligase-associated DNA damage response DEXH box helicase [Fulvivirga aurantia]MTI22019.1 ligase-associated DNA damage response DEXH box helicase [Fulvivirga aurantia]
MQNKLIPKAIKWFQEKGWKPFPFQTETWEAYLNGQHGLVNAPTGSGKTYSLVMPVLLEYIRENYKRGKPLKNNGLRVIWITPIKALAKEISYSAQRAIEGLDLDWQVAIRSGDTSTKDRQKLKKTPPEFLITTPESLQLMLAQKGYDKYFKNLRAVVCDEWHELIGSKRGVQMELALSRLKTICEKLKIWGISATIGNMEDAVETLLGDLAHDKKHYTLIKADIKKQIEVDSVLPDELEKLPWAGHLGAQMVDKVIPIIKESKSTLIFTNTRSFAEIWYQKLLERAPELAGIIALHHGSISRELRDWVEEALHAEQLKAVVCTSSLDLGVDFRPVETIIQVGSPKGVARFMQRAGRSGHQPGALSKIYFVPTHSLELIEAASMRQAIKEGLVEDRIPYLRSFDVLIQYLVTLAVSDGFTSEQIFEEVKSTFCYASIEKDEWQWLLAFITTGGAALTAYDEFRKVEFEDGVYKVTNRRVAMRHRMSIGTIVSDTSIKVKYVSGKYIGTIEEYFISKLQPGDVFWFSGRNLELVRIKEMVAQVRNSKKKSGKVPSWQGGRMPLSSQMSVMLRKKLNQIARGIPTQDPEVAFLQPLMDLQKNRSYLPNDEEFLIEYFQTNEGYHVLMYPFEGRFVHEGMGALLAHRIARIKPITFSIAMNDYGFELLSDQEIPIYEAIETDALGVDDLYQDIQASINSVEMARRRFRDIAAISGLVFKGYPGQQVKDRHLQSSSQLFFDVFQDYENESLLLLQAYEEVMDFQLEEARLRNALERINQQKFIITEPEKPTPFAFPIMVDRTREKLSSEKLQDRIKKMQLQFQ